MSSTTTTALPRGTVTFLLTDIQSSTQLWEQAPTAMRDAMAHHDSIIERTVADHGGAVVRPRGEGDSRFAVFPSATAAINAAAEMQRALCAERWDTPFPLRVRIGVHTGEADVREGDYYGTAVNRCARLRGAAHGGQTIISQVAADMFFDSPLDGLTLRDLGEHRLKDLQRAEHIYQLIIPGLPNEFPPLNSLDNIPNNLPAALTSFVGRAREMAEVKRLLHATRLLTITGSGGAGKTRLALEVAADVLGTFLDGVWLIELAPLNEGALIARTLANTLSIREEANRDIVQTLIDYTRGRTMLIILDNCEHLIQAAAEAAIALLQGAPNLRILATSREPLGSTGEVVWAIPPLSLPDVRRDEPMDQVTQYEAVKLFIDRALAVQPNFAVTNQNAPAVAEICARLDGIPLAIELAAARVRVLSVEDIAARLDDRFRLLVGGSRTALPRQQTLRALIDWSYDLLSETEQLMLRRLSIFSGGWMLEDAEEVCSDRDLSPAGRIRGAIESTAREVGPPDPFALASKGGASIFSEDVLDLITRLVDKSLVIVEASGGDSPRAGECYRLLETIRQYGQAQLAVNGETEPLAARHAEYFFRLVDRSGRELWGPKQGYWLKRHEDAHDNLRAALEYFAADPNRAGKLLRMAGALWRFWEIRGYLGEGRVWLDRALENAEGANPYDRANALRGAGNLARQQGDYAEGQRLHVKSLELFRAIDNELGIARELDVLGEIARYQGDYTRAVEYHTQALQLLRKIGGKEGIAGSLNNLGVVEHDRGNAASAKSLLEEALQFNREIGDKLNTALSLNNLGLVAHDESDYARSNQLYGESLALYREMGDRLGISYVLLNQANVAKDQGHFKQATVLYTQAMALKQELGDKRGIARCKSGLAEVAFYQGDYGRAQSLGEESYKLFDQVGVRRGMLLSLEILAFIAQYQGDFDTAAERGAQALALSQELGARRAIAFSHELLGLVAYSRGTLDEALSELQQALEVFRQTHDVRNVGFTLVNLARTAYRQNDMALAQQYLDLSLSHSRQIGDEWGIAFSLEIQALLLRSQGEFARATELLKESLQLSAQQENKQGIVNCIGALAGIAATHGDVTRAARLFGASETLREAMGAQMGAGDAAEYERYLQMMRAQPEGERFEDAWAQGRALTMQQAIDQALETTETP